MEAAPRPTRDTVRWQKGVTGPRSSQSGAGGGWRWVEEVTNLSRTPQFHFPRTLGSQDSEFPLCPVFSRAAGHYTGAC